MSDLDFRAVLDRRGFIDEIVDPREWRIYMRKAVFAQRKGLSDLSKTPITFSSGFDLHEGIFPRRYMPKGALQDLLFAGPNCFILLPQEHSPKPPSREACYWISCANYGKDVVDSWIDSLPFRSNVPMPWKGTLGSEVLYRLYSEMRLTEERWQKVYYGRFNRIDCEA